jgi:prepilin peptidase CpaA
MTGQVCIALFVGLAAATEDIARRRISNWIPVAAFLAGLTWMVWQRGWRGGISSITGAVAGFAVFLIFYWLGGMGGGDVKLMAGFGAVLGIERLLQAALWTAAFGGVIAALAVAFASLRKLSNRPAQNPKQPVTAIPYAPAIALGAWVALLSRT